MVAHAKTWLASLGVPKVNLMFRETNQDVRAFYERLGYAVERRTVMSPWLAGGPPPPKSG